MPGGPVFNVAYDLLDLAESSGLTEFSRGLFFTQFGPSILLRCGSSEGPDTDTKGLVSWIRTESP